MPPEGGESYLPQEGKFFVLVSPFTYEGKTNGGKEFKITEGTEKFVRHISGWKILVNMLHITFSSKSLTFALSGSNRQSN